VDDACRSEIDLARSICILSNVHSCSLCLWTQIPQSSDIPVQPQRYSIIMANRGRTLDPEVFSIKDLKEKASQKLPKMYRGNFVLSHCSTLG
jgi:hypothetical protein